MTHFRPLRSATLLAAVTGWVLLGACGKSDHDNGNAPAGTGGDGPATGGSGGSGAQGGSAGSEPSCTYNGKRYANGETFGACDECVCAEGGVFCTNIDCTPGTGGNGATGGAPVGGASGTGGSQGGMGGNGGTPIADGGTGPFPIGGAGAGGSVVGGSAGTGMSEGGEGGVPTGDCASELLTKFCVVGVPDGDLMKLDEGVDISIAMYPAGCSCSEIVSTTCSPLTSKNEIMVSPWVCLLPDGDDCTEQCRDDQIARCDVWNDLTEGTWTVSIPRTTLSVTFQVPSSVPADRLCASVE